MFRSSETFDDMTSWWKNSLSDRLWKVFGSSDVQPFQRSLNHTDLGLILSLTEVSFCTDDCSLEVVKFVTGERFSI